ncbi:putative lysine-specific demethylase JMJD5 isoform X2 [Panicum miliaceum]|uniref:Lysine-specific demethylase JMJD5 isoform X2 n=1 Tax=Panicum miliaceum TaxID=4540 RepID=A0A3L6Q6Z8_PANMI|nr:putative lysine-specific demethylase JMJD5 isoform X2 [Panicum miliaceum]
MATGGGEKRAALLRRITEEGGFAFVSSAEKAAAGDVRAAEAAREMAWEQLHSAPRDEVGAAWQDAYALACLHVAALRGAGGDDDRRAALRALDMGLIMGGGLLRAELEDAIARVVADRRGGRDGDCEAASAAGDVERWKEGIAGDRDLADVLKLLPVKSLSRKKIERRSCIPLEAFIRDYFICESPVILSGCIDHWPARTKWKDIKYLERIAGDRTIPVEELITFSQFLERMWSSDSANLTYLAQHPLFDQVLGRKYFRLYPASVSVELYPQTETMLSNTSQVDLDNFDQKEFPKAADLEFMDGILEEVVSSKIHPSFPPINNLTKHHDRRNGGDARAAAIAPNISSPWASMDKDLVDLIGWRVLDSDMLNYVRPLPRRLHQLVAFQHQVLNFLGAVWRGDIPQAY